MRDGVGVVSLDCGALGEGDGGEFVGIPQSGGLSDIY